MENLTEQEKSFIIDALNQYWHQANSKLVMQGLGALERKNWKEIKSQSAELMRKLDS